MKNLIACSFVILLCFTFCKKKDKTPDPATTNSTTTGSNTNLQPASGGEFCELQTSYTYIDNHGVVSKDSSVFASFYSAPASSVVPTNVSGGTVTLNNTVIPFQSSQNFYYFISALPVNISGTLSWNVTGSGTVTAFSQSFTPTYPKYTGGNLLPDTCIKANGITINISGVSNNQNSVSIFLYGGSASAYKYIFGSNGSVTFTAADLSGFPVNQPLTISVDFTNGYDAVIGGIKRGFANTVNYQKMSYLK